MKTKQITVLTNMFEDYDAVWKRLDRFEALHRLAAPLVSFVPIEENDTQEWTEGTVVEYRLRLFGLIPLGVHTIHVNAFDMSKGYINTQESNRFVRMWNHTIIVEPLSEVLTRYYDVVEIDAGWMTGIIAKLCEAYYRRREQRLATSIYDKQDAARFLMIARQIASHTDSI